MKRRKRRDKSLHVGDIVLMIKRNAYTSVRRKLTHAEATHAAQIAANSDDPPDQIVVARIIDVIRVNRSNDNAEH